MKEMNEKELKKEIVEIFKKYKSVEDIGTRLIMLGFQKGKLEQKKEELEFLEQVYKLLPFSKGLRMIEERIRNSKKKLERRKENEKRKI